MGYICTITSFYYFHLFQVNTNGRIEFAPQRSREFFISDYIDVYSPVLSTFTFLTKKTLFYRETSDATLICRASQRIRTFFPELNFEADYLFIATWKSILNPTSLTGIARSSDANQTLADPLNDPSDDLTNTFQAVLASDGRYSFILLNYGNLMWPTPEFNGDDSSIRVKLLLVTLVTPFFFKLLSAFQ